MFIFSLEKPLFISDGRNQELTLIVRDILFASEKNIFVTAQFIITENIKNNKYFDQESIQKTIDTNETLELIINKNGDVYGEQINEYHATNFNKYLFENFMYNNMDGEIDKNLTEDKFLKPQVKIKHIQNFLSNQIIF